jgi:hypothetical protein
MTRWHVPHSWCRPAELSEASRRCRDLPTSVFWYGPLTPFGDRLDRRKQSGDLWISWAVPSPVIELRFSSKADVGASVGKARSDAHRSP